MRGRGLELVFVFAKNPNLFFFVGGGGENGGG